MTRDDFVAVFLLSSGPDVAVPDDAGPSVFAAVQQQLGLRLESVRAPVDVLVIERLERPTEN